MVTVGKILRKARAEKNITLDVAEEETKVRRKYLEAIEKENWDVFASRVYITGVIKRYSSYLGIDPEKTVAYFRRDYEKNESLDFKKKLPSLGLLPATRKIMYFLLALLISFFGLYFVYQFSQYLTPPKITIISPEKRMFRNITQLDIVGKTKPESTIKIFDQEIFPDKDGVFEYKLPVEKGENILNIKVTGPNGKESELTEKFILE